MRVQNTNFYPRPGVRESGGGSPDVRIMFDISENEKFNGDDFTIFPFSMFRFQ